MTFITTLWVFLLVGFAVEAWLLFTLALSARDADLKNGGELLKNLPRYNLLFSLALALVPLLLHISFAITFERTMEAELSAAPFSLLVFYTLPSALVFVLTSGRGFSLRRTVEARQGYISKSC